MPLYEYICPYCEYHDELIRPVVERNSVYCPICMIDNRYQGMRRQIAAPAFTVSGFNASNGYSK